MQTPRLLPALLSATALLLASLSPDTGSAQGQPATAKPQVQTVATLTVSAPLTGSTYRFNGHVEAVRQATLAAQVGGNVLSFTAKAGDRVKAGELLARIDERSAEASVRASAAGVDQAEALLQSAKLHAERTQALRQQGFVSGAAVDDAQVRLRAAQAGLDQARAGRSQASLQQGFASVRAPFDGVVLATHVELGDLATPGRPLMTVYAPGRLRAVVDVPSSRVAAARAAGQWEVMGADGKRWTPTSRTELPSADPVAQTTEWRLELPLEAAASLSPGASVEVRLTSASATAASPTPSGSPAAVAHPRIPAQAVLLRGELTAVFAVLDGRFVLRPIRIAGPLGGADVEVVAGLRPGDLIAADAVRAGLAGAVPAR
jgi:RND family efflux transporter MFP subunit